jgi:hypothetical protein
MTASPCNRASYRVRASARAARRILPLVDRWEKSLRRLERPLAMSTEELALRSLHPRNDDVYIVAFPRSGTTLLQMLLYQLTTCGSMNLPHIQAVAPSIDELLLRGNADYLERLRSPRIFKTHWLWECLGEHVKNARCIYAIRHPGDVLISSYYHRRLHMGRDIEFTDLVQRGFLHVPPYGTWMEHTGSWWPHRNDKNVCLVHYEDLVRNGSREVERIAAFLDVPLTSEIAQRVENRTSFDFMKRHELKFDPRLATVSWDAPDSFIRLGRTGEWEGLDPRVIRRLDGEIENVAIAVAEGGELLRRRFLRGVGGEIVDIDSAGGLSEANELPTRHGWRTLLSPGKLGV